MVADNAPRALYPARPVGFDDRVGSLPSVSTSSALMVSLLAGLVGCAKPATPTATPSPAPTAEPEDAPSPAPAPAAAVDEGTPAPEPLTAAPQPIADRHREAFLGSPEDPPSEELGGVTRAQEGQHYVAGNEKRLHLIYPQIKDIGGGYVGVGTDQAYLFIGWARSELAWLIDYDPVVLDVHACHRAFFLESDTPAKYLSYWGKPGKADAIALLEKVYEGDARDRAIAVYKRYRGWIERRLRGLEKRYTKIDEVPTFLTDQETYDYVRAMIENGRVRPMQANLLRSGAVEGLGAAARELGVPVRLLYLSNAEQYWDEYAPEFRTNMQALYFDDRSFVLHTLLTWQKNQDYRYALQPAHNFQAWLGRPWFTTINQMVPPPPRKVPEDAGDAIDLIELDADPDTSKAAKRAAEGS